MSDAQVLVEFGWLEATKLVAIIRNEDPQKAKVIDFQMKSFTQASIILAKGSTSIYFVK